MSSESPDLPSLVEKLRQEQEFVQFYKSQIRQGVQELNNSCDDVFHSLWLTHTLSFGLQRVLTHTMHCYEWSMAVDQEVEFVNASKVLQSHKHVDSYSKFLSMILSNTKLLSEILHLAESEGLDCHWVVSDLMSVVFGHCIFQRDHTHFLHLLRELIKQHVKFCHSPNDLFGGVESVFNKVLVEYCSQHIELKTFLSELLQEAIMEVLSFDDYLEFDVNKAGSRFHVQSERNGPLINTSTFLFGEDLESSCDHLARLAMLVVKKLSLMRGQFPLSLKWLLSNLKSIAKLKWPLMTQSEVRRLISDAIFGSILSGAIVNPDNHAIVESSVVVGSVARYNLTQVTAVLQRSSWNMEKHSINKVIKRMDMELYTSVLDNLDGGCNQEVPDLPSSLPGLKRSSFLASQSQLNNLVGLAASLLTNREGSGVFHTQLSELLSILPHPLIDMASTQPYCITLTPVAHPPTLSLRELKKARGDGSKVRGKKRGSMGHSAHTNVDPTLSFPRSRSMGGIVSMDVRGGTAERGSMRTSPPADPSTTCGLLLPIEVLILPFTEDVGSREQWDFHLLSEEEFMTPATPTNRNQDEDVTSPSKQSSPDNSITSVTMTTSFAPTNTTDEGSFALSSPPKKPLDHVHSAGAMSVKDMINQIEGGRLRSNTLPPKSPSDASLDLARGLRSESGTPMHSWSPTKGAWLSGLTVREEEFVNPYDKLEAKDAYIPSAESSLIGSPVSQGFIELASEATPTITASPAEATDQVSGDGVVDDGGVLNIEGVVNGIEPTPPDDLSGNENDMLLNQELPQEPLKKVTKKRKKFWRFRKHKSVDSSAKPAESASKPRSKSEHAKKVTIEPPVSKSRSKSEHGLLEEPGGFLKRSYTLLTGHITAKYAALEAKRRVSQITQRATTEEIPRALSNHTATKLEHFDSKPPAEMSPQAFQSSLFCDQLKYKLRAVLQNIHMPLAKPGGEDTHCQLMLLLQHSLQRGRWRQDSMSVSLLTEVLTMVDPLPSQLVQVAVEGLLKDYNSRSSYIAYLVKSHQRFQDAKLQVSALQASVNRMREVDRELFVSFAVRLYLEAKDADLKQFSQDLAVLQLADEKCSLMDRRQRTLEEAINDDPTWLCWGDMEGVVSCLDNHLFAHVYEYIFHPNGDSDTMRDQIFSQHLTRLSDNISITDKSLQIPSVYHSSSPWSSAQTHLKTMTAYKSPHGKLQCVVRCCKILISLLQYAKCGDPPGADDMFPVIVYVLIKANPPGLLSTVQYIKNFIEPSLSGEDAYWWAQFSTAVEFTKTLE